MVKNLVILFLQFRLVGLLTLKKGLQGCVAGKTPFHTPSATPQDTLFSIFHFHKTPFKTKITKFPIFCSKCLNLVNFQFLSLKISQNPVQEAPFEPKIISEGSILSKKRSIQQALNLVPIRSSSPYFETLLPHTPIFLKCKYPFWEFRFQPLSLYINADILCSCSHAVNGLAEGPSKATPAKKHTIKGISKAKAAIYTFVTVGLRI